MYAMQLQALTHENYNHHPMQVAVKVVDLLCVPPAARQALLTDLTEMLSRLEAAAAASAHTCQYHGVCLQGGQLLLIMRRYSNSLAGVLAEHASGEYACSKRLSIGLDPGQLAQLS